MSVRNLTLMVFVLLAGSLPLAAAASGKPAKPAIEMSAPEQADSSAAEAPISQDEPAREANEPEAGEASKADAIAEEAAKGGTPAAEKDASSAAEKDVAASEDTEQKTAADQEKAVTGKDADMAGKEAAGTAPRDEAEKPSFLRRFAHAIGLASDPTPGQVAAAGAPSPPLVQDYLIGPGDLLGISVWRDDNLTRTPVVLPDGRISFPLVGEVQAAGKTVAQLKAEMEKKLTRFVSDAQLTVEVKQSNSMIVYLLGRVNTPGRQLLVASTNVLQALAMAGGPNPFANKGDIKIYRQEDGKTVVYPFDYGDVSDGRHLETNIELKRGDVILVP